MIRGIGIDVVDVRRIERAMANPRFIDRILTASERSGALTPSRVAGRWAAKEAAAKALGTHLRWHDVEVVGGGSEPPSLRLVAGAPGAKLHLSISHERDLAAAVVVVETDR